MTKYVHGTEADEQERLAKLNKLTNPPFIDFLSPQTSDHILEVGSGLGILAGEVAAIATTGRVVGIEYSAEQMAKVTAQRENLEFLRGDAHSLPFADGTFDMVYSRYLLEHVNRPVVALREMHRVLKPGGRVCVQENDIAVFQLWPQCPTWTKLWANFGKLQTILGGDAYIGRKLFDYFQQAGFSRIELGLYPEFHYAGLPTFELWMHNALKILEASGPDLVARKMATEEEMTTTRAEIERFITLKEAASYFYWNRVRAIK